jgi:hypothetical protein
LNELHWHEFPDLFKERTVRWICRYLTDVEFVSLRHQVSVLANTIREGMPIVITNAQLSQLFGDPGGWAQGMIARHITTKSKLAILFPGPQMVESGVKWNLVQFCFPRQAERHPASVEDIIDYMREADKQVDRFWVNRFVERNTEKLALRQATFLEASIHKVNSDEVILYVMEKRFPADKV